MKTIDTVGPIEKVTASHCRLRERSAAISLVASQVLIVALHSLRTLIRFRSSYSIGRIAIVAFFWLCGSQIFADSSITITLVNNTNKKFTISHIETKPGTRISMSQNVLEANSQVSILGTIQISVDLEGSIHFSEGAQFRIKVNRLNHFGQPIFYMRADSVNTIVDQKSLKFNSDGIPDHLLYTAATVILEPQRSKL